jgi:hypothetical protein
VNRAGITEHTQRCTCPTKRAARESGYESFYYQCDEKFPITIRGSRDTAKWVKGMHAVGEITQFPVALTRLKWQGERHSVARSVPDSHLFLVTEQSYI